jgi:hypothetical protein
LETLEKLECERGSSENVAGSVFHWHCHWLSVVEGISWTVDTYPKMMDISRQ